YPFRFSIANELAKKIQLSAFDLPYFYKDNKLYKGIPLNQNLITTDSLITLLQTEFTYKINSDQYGRSRLLDMLVGNSSKVAHDYLWKSKKQNSDLIFSPVVTDRGFSFLK